MDFFDSRYFNINKNMLRMIGLWPFQKRIEKLLIRPPVVTCLLLFSVPQILNIFLYLSVDISRVLQAITILFYMVMVTLKTVMAIILEKKFRNIYECIAQNWRTINEEDDVTVLLRNSEFGRYLTIGYMSYMFSALIAFVTMPMLPLLFDMIIPLNESRPLIFILEGEYLVDRYENYKTIYVFELFVSAATVTIFSTVDSTYAVCVQQCVALMDIVKLHLDTTKNAIQKSVYSEIRERETAHDSIVEAIRLHQKAIDFANVLESTYTGTYLVAICLNAIILSVGSSIIIMNLHRPMEVLRYILIHIGLMIHLFYLAWMGQLMIDASDDLLAHTHRGNWYNYSIKTQKILQFMMMRCRVPCQLTAGGICVLNVENFGAVLKTSLSYITVFASMVY